MLTKKQKNLLMFINKKLRSSGVSPSYEEMKESLNLKSKSGIHRLISALEEVPFKTNIPNVIIANTVKGSGVSFIENQISWHHKVPSKEEFEKANLELESQLKSYE